MTEKKSGRQIRREILNNPGVSGRKHSLNQHVLSQVRDGETRMEGRMKSRGSFDIVVIPPKTKK